MLLFIQSIAKQMKVMKFGGTSVGAPHRMKEIALLVTSQKEPVIVVLSALSGTTNTLVKISDTLLNGQKEVASQIIQALKEHYHTFLKSLFTTAAGQQAGDAIIKEHFEFLEIILKINYSEALSKDILAQGELLSTKIFAAYLTELGVAHQYVPALQFMCIDENDEPKIDAIAEKLLPILTEYTAVNIFVTQGYICKNAKGEVDNLKRGGSDYTASLIAAAVNASVCEIWTDIDGMHNNDPRVVENTVPIETLSFDEAAELAYFGAKILHPASIWPAQTVGVPVKLLNTMQPTATGTTISNVPASAGVKAIAAKDEIIAIKIKSSRMLLAYGFLRKIFEVFEKYRTPIDMITTSEVAVSLTIDNATFLDSICKELAPLGVVEVEHGQTIVSVVGYQLTVDQQFLAKLFKSIAHIPITMVSYGGSQHNVSILIPAGYKEPALKALNYGLFSL
jgi:aspartate kinase